MFEGLLKWFNNLHKIGFTGSVILHWYKGFPKKWEENKQGKVEDLEVK